MISRDHRHYFAYGENMHPQVIAQRCGDARVLGVGRLDGFRLEFFGHSGKWDGAVESVVPDPAACLFGVLYELDFSVGEGLDEHLDARMDGTGGHFHYPVDIHLEDGTTTDALMYILSSMGPARPPSEDYLRFLAEGARLNSLPEAYVEQLSARASRVPRYEVPLTGKGPGKGGCGDCGDMREELRKR